MVANLLRKLLFFANSKSKIAIKDTNSMNSIASLFYSRLSHFLLPSSLILCKGGISFGSQRGEEEIEDRKFGRKIRENSPEFEELLAQIDALK